MKKMKRLIALVSTLAVVMTMVIALPTSAYASAPTKESVKYKGSGVVEVDFLQKVKYKNLKITVKDTSGKSYTVSNVVKDNDDVKFKIKNYKAGKTYNFTIKGIRKVNTSKYGNVTGSVKIPKSTTASAPTIESVKYKGSGVVEVDFHQKVKYSNLKITVKDTSGKSYNVSNIIKDDDDVKFKIKSYKTGTTYNFTINGICRTSSSNYVSISNSIKIPAKQTYISKSKAHLIAINDAVKRYGIIESSVWDPSIESDTYRGTAIWEVDFEAEGSDGNWYEIEYKINKKTGKILLRKAEIE